MGIYQDDWSKLRPTFGESNQVTVIGYNGMTTNNKYYYVHCDICSNDPELFGDANFKTRKSALLRGCLPCGCSGGYNWSKEQWIIRCKRKLSESGYSFIGFSGDWKGSNTKIKAFCDIHGEWKSTSLNSLFSQNRMCPDCGMDNRKHFSSYPDDHWIRKFIQTSSYDETYEFERIQQKDHPSNKSGYWKVHCPICDTTVISHNSNLARGSKGCECSSHNQKQAYINMIVDGENVIALKFGIATNAKIRKYSLQTYCTHTVKIHSVYSFQTVLDCKNAERECLQELKCGVLSKSELEQGWTETTHVGNLDKIIEIYERNGGNLLV